MFAVLVCCGPDPHDVGWLGNDGEAYRDPLPDARLGWFATEAEAHAAYERLPAGWQPFGVRRLCGE